MGIGGGGDRSWLTPLRPDGNLRHDTHGVNAEIRGGHRGFYAGLNSGNPRPGFQYGWGHNDPSQTLMARQRGWQVVQQGDEDGPAYRFGGGYDSTDTPTPLDTADVFQDIIYMRIPEHKLRVLREEEQRRAEQMLHGGGASAYINAADEAEIIAGHGKATRFARRDHQTQIRRGSEVLAEWSPGAGVVTE